MIRIRFQSLSEHLYTDLFPPTTRGNETGDENLSENNTWNAKVTAARGIQLSYVDRMTISPASGKSSAAGGKSSTTDGKEKPRTARAKHPERQLALIKCNRNGHLEQVCFSKAVATVSAQKEELAYPFSARTLLETTWSVHIQLESRKLKCKLYTGAEVTAISEESCNRVGNTRGHQHHQSCIDKASKLSKFCVFNSTLPFIRSGHQAHDLCH